MCSSVLGEIMTSLDDSLLSMEKLDRTSPELWPEQSNPHFQCLCFLDFGPDRILIIFNLFV